MDPVDLDAAVEHAERRTRRRIAQALHDDLQQHLHGLQVRVAGLEGELARGREIDPEAMTDIARRIDAAMGVLRSVTGDLARPAASAGLLADLERVVDDMAEIHGLEVTLHADTVDVVMSRRALDVTASVARELLFNVVKHGSTSRADVHVSVDGGLLVLVVADAGRESAAAVGDPTGMGLRSLRAQVGALGGTIESRVAPAGGTVVTVSIPVPDRSAGPDQPEETAALT